MKSYAIAAIPGDGIGAEVIQAGIDVLMALTERDGSFQLRIETFDWGSEHYIANDCMMPADGLEKLKNFDAIYFGSAGDPRVPDHISLWGLRLAICQPLEQYANVRPARLLPGIEGPLKDVGPGDLDWVIVRENTEGEYAPVGGRLYPGTPHETVMQTNVFTRRGTERIIRAAFEHCVKRNKKNLVTSVTKSNAQAFGMVFWDEVFESVANDYPNIKTESLLVDRVAMDLVRWPEEFDVMVASNLFADIISDIAAVATGSMGLAASANVNPEGIHPSMFESVHGAAFDIAGKGIANPLATISAVGLMLEHLGENESARRIEGAVMRSLEERRAVTGDLGGQASTEEVGDEVVRLLSA